MNILGISAKVMNVLYIFTLMNTPYLIWHKKIISIAIQRNLCDNKYL